MKTKLLIALALAALPFAANAMPAVGDDVGTNPTDAKAALAKAGCEVKAFEAENGRIEARCTDAAQKSWEVYINPKTGKVADVKSGD